MQAALPGKAGIICRVRPRADAGPAEWRYSKIGEDGTFSVPALTFLKPGIGFQVGWTLDDDGSHPVFGEWVNVTAMESE